MNRTYQVGASSVQPWFNKTGAIMTTSPVKIENLPIVMSQRHNQSKKQNDSYKVSKSYDSRTATPDGCKGVQIDSSMDMRDEDYSDQQKQEITLKSKGGDTRTDSEDTTGKEEQKLELVPQLHMSTHLFNGDYLVQTVNQNTPSMQASPYASRVVLPNQLILNNSSPAKRGNKKVLSNKPESK